MFNRILLASCFSLLLNTAAFAQTTMTLRNCIEYAWLNNLDVRQATLNKASVDIDKSQSRTNMLPSVSANAGQNYQFGRSIDRFTNQFINQTIRSNNMSVNASMLLFGGLQLQNNIKQMNASALASQSNIEQIKNQIALNIANAFLQVIQAEENIHIAELQIQATTQRLNKAQKQVDAGTADLTNLLGLNAQLANEELNLINMQNANSSALLNLRTLMQWPYDQALLLEKPIIKDEALNASHTVDAIYPLALDHLPQIKMAEQQAKAAKYQRKAAQGSMFPSISLFASLSTVYSQSAKLYSNPRVTGTQLIGYTQTSQEAVYQPTYAFDIQTKAFSSQLKDNIGQGAGLSFSWNVFNGLQVQHNIQKAKINSEISDLNLQRNKNNLLNEVNTAVNNYKAAQYRYNAHLKNTDAQKTNFEYIQKRFDAGMTGMTEFTQTKNNYLQAQSNAIQAKYELVFRHIILNYYKGEQIHL
ncbi:MAG: hypothetical protein RLZZ318_1377 [Bacteroidota bacterium]